MAEIFEAFRPGASGWLFMWALLFTAAFMVAVAIERGYYIWVKSNINSSKFMSEIRRNPKIPRMARNDDLIIMIEGVIHSL